MRKRADAPKPTALEKAVDLLAQQDHSTAKLREKLVRRGYGADEIDAAVERLTARHYLDDEAVCLRQFRYLYEETHMSMRQIRQKLFQRGFSPVLIDACVPDDLAEREASVAEACLVQKFSMSKPVPAIKMKEFLFRRGFGYAACEAAAAAYAEARAADDAEDGEPFSD